MSKFGNVDEKGRPLLLETDTHGVVRKTLMKLEKLGYIEDYSENLKRSSRLILPKLAFANTDFKEKTDIYNIKFQRTEKPIDLENSELRRMFPGVFGTRGIINSQGYNIKYGENGELVIDYGKGKPKTKEPLMQEQDKSSEQREPSLRERVKADISLEEQRDFVNQVIEENGIDGNKNRDESQKDVEKE